jgi:hypothetical protein
VAPKRKLTSSEKRESVLAQLKFPLVFFGLCLLVTESTFGAVLLMGRWSENVGILFGSLMAGLFLVTIGLVGWLTYVAPRHLMLLPQEKDEANRLSEATSKMYQYLQKRDPIPSDVIQMFAEVDRLLNGEETVKP